MSLNLSDQFNFELYRPASAQLTSLPAAEATTGKDRLCQTQGKDLQTNNFHWKWTFAPAHIFKLGVLAALLLLSAAMPAHANKADLEMPLPYGLKLYYQPENLEDYDPLYPLYWSFDLESLIRKYDFNLSLPDVPSLVPACWHDLAEKLVADGMNRSWIEDIFIRLGSCYTVAPMKTKLSELYKIRYSKKKEKKKSAKPKTAYYRNLMTERNAQRAINFLREYSEIFQAAETAYGVPKEIAVSLLLVETDLGSYLGKHTAMLNLASMAASTKKEIFYPHFPGISGNFEKEEWVQSVLDKRSEWAYKELAALLTYTHENHLDPLKISGSIYGAIGYCQFMPSNIIRFGVDGNNDHKIDLFDPADAIHSLSNYLVKHGWENGLDENGKRTVLLEYNRSNAYANTILIMASALAKRQK